MRIWLNLAADVGYYGWVVPAFVMVYMPGRRTSRFWLRWLRLGCAAFLPSWVVITIVSPPTLFWAWPLWLLNLPTWRAVHRRFCRHDHTKRLRDAVRGLVQRFGNRLRVIPETA